MKMKSRIMILLVMCMAFSLVQAQEAKRSITRVAGDVYRFQNNFHVNVFVITGEGVVVTDPIDADAVLWLAAEIASITSEPLTHLVYSHSHGDHASGGLAYDEIPTVIVHANAPEEIDGIEPTLRFSEAMQFTRGNKTFELTYLGPGHGEDLIAMVIRPENVGFIVDVVSSKRLFYRDFPNANIDDWINQVRKVQSLEFDILVGGHGPVGVKSDVDDALAYLKELRAAVLKGLKDGKSVDELSESIKMEKYQDWANYDSWLKLNIQGMARHLKQSGVLN
jgi:glyoxylase-like metal-dependent hydrolase (beta-lactamase superfamily II)